jgi:hypothetical protein
MVDISPHRPSRDHVKAFQNLVSWAEKVAAFQYSILIATVYFGIGPRMLGTDKLNVLGFVLTRDEWPGISVFIFMGSMYHMNRILKSCELLFDGGASQRYDMAVTLVHSPWIFNPFTCVIRNGKGGFGYALAIFLFHLLLLIMAKDPAHRIAPGVELWIVCFFIGAPCVILWAKLGGTIERLRRVATEILSNADS